MAKSINLQLKAKKNIDTINRTCNEIISNSNWNAIKQELGDEDKWLAYINAMIAKYWENNKSDKEITLSPYAYSYSDKIICSENEGNMIVLPEPVLPTWDLADAYEGLLSKNYINGCTAEGMLVSKEAYHASETRVMVSDDMMFAVIDLLLDLSENGINYYDEFLSDTYFHDKHSRITKMIFEILYPELKQTVLCLLPSWITKWHAAGKLKLTRPDTKATVLLPEATANK